VTVEGGDRQTDRQTDEESAVSSITWSWVGFASFLQDVSACIVLRFAPVETESFVYFSRFYSV
jgi:hypothetical protein